MPRVGVVAAALGAAAVVAGCGSVRTELPTSVAPPPPLVTVGSVPDSLVTITTTTAAPATTASEYKSPGEKHPLSGGTVSVSYPRVGVRPARGVESAPAGQAWAVVNVRFCAGPEAPIGGDLVDPARFRVEVPGQGYVAPTPGGPAMAPGALSGGTPVEPGTCVEGSVAYLVGGEGHVESVTYDAGDGLLRWAA